MPGPKTLLQLAGATPAAPRLDGSALVLIDAQAEYRDGALPLDGIEAAVARLAELLERARRAGATVLHVAHHGRAGGLFDRDAAGGRFLPELAPRGGEAVIEKGLPNAFAGTDLDARLRALGQPPLILAGFMTHMCVSSTARAALDLGHGVAIAQDATATRALPGPDDGEALPAALVQAASLAALGDRFATLVRARDIAG